MKIFFIINILFTFILSSCGFFNNYQVDSKEIYYYHFDPEAGAIHETKFLEVEDDLFFSTQYDITGFSETDYFILANHSVKKAFE